MAIAAGGYHTCALLTGGTVECWGSNQFGELGNGINSQPFIPSQSSAPSAVTGLSGVVGLSGAGDDICAVLSNGTVKCWGSNQSGSIGDPTAIGSSSSPVLISNVAGASGIGSSYSHTCALLAVGTMKCWGYNVDGELGDGTTSNQLEAPVDVSGLSGVTGVAVGHYHTCALVLSASVECWGRNDYGDLGNGQSADSSVPVSVQGLQ